MAKRKLQRFKEMKSLPHVFEPLYEEIKDTDYPLKNNWGKTFFKNNNPIVLELGCGKGEYTVKLAEKFPDKNFIGVDIKGARMWKGCKDSYEKGLKNVAFLRVRIEFINRFFSSGEVSEIWLTFPDPQIKKLKKRLTSAAFLNSYRKILNEGIIHLKTDSELMFYFTLDIVERNKLELLDKVQDIYHNCPEDELLSIKTFYESQYIERGLKINYVKFKLQNKEIENPQENYKLQKQEFETRKRTGSSQIIRMRKKRNRIDE